MQRTYVTLKIKVCTFCSHRGWIHEITGHGSMWKSGGVAAPKLNISARKRSDSRCGCFCYKDTTCYWKS